MQPIRTLYQPEWISEAAVMDWLNCSRSWLCRLRQSGKINFSKIGDKTMYDKKEFVALLNEASTYTVSNPELKLVV